MTGTSKQRQVLAFGVPGLIFIACSLATLTPAFRQNSVSVSYAIAFDFMITAPVACYLLIRGTTVSPTAVVRVFLLGLLLTSIVLPRAEAGLLHAIRTWLLPVAETTLISYIIWKFYHAGRLVKQHPHPDPDFFTGCRHLLQEVTGSQGLAAILAQEIAVFYYLFGRKKNTEAPTVAFTVHRENGTSLLLTTILFLLLIETAAMHFLVQLWNETVAWILTGVGLYTGLQLWSHIRSFGLRPVVVTNEQVLLRNGLLGGETAIHLQNIRKIEKTTKSVSGEGVVKLAFLPGFEKHQVAIYLDEPVTVLKAFGVTKKAAILLLPVDNADRFIAETGRAAKEARE